MSGQGKRRLPAIEAAAEWWASKLGGFGTAGDGMIDAMSILAGAQGGGAGMAERVRFREALATALQEQADRQGDEFRATLATDYAPEGKLRDALDEVACRAPLPNKTVMWIDAARVDVKHGYGAATVRIYGEPVAVEAR